MSPPPPPDAVAGAGVPRALVLDPPHATIPGWTIPAIICSVLLVVDLMFGAAYLANRLAGNPVRVCAVLLDLNGEHNLPAWYSSMQWLCIALVVGVHAHLRRASGDVRWWQLGLLAGLFLALSVDESVALHEAFGHTSDALLPGGDRASTPFARTGIWGLLLGPPFLLTYCVLVRLALRTRSMGRTKLVLGMVVMLLGATGLETASNFVAPGSWLDVTEVFLEEVLEMIGATVVFWGACELFAAEGGLVSLSPEPRTPQHVRGG